MKKQIRLNAFAMNCVAHQSPGLWTHPRDRTAEYNRLPYWIDLAKTLERGRFDGLFLADVLGVYDVFGGSPDAALRNATQTPANEPLLLIPAMAAVTEHLGFGVTSNLSYEPPYPFARRMSTLDHLTDGRVGWNVVTGYLDSAAAAPARTSRPRMTTATMSPTNIWRWSTSSGKEAGRTTPRCAIGRAAFSPIPPRCIGSEHEGNHYRLDAIHLSEPSPQRTPVLYQAGTSPRGRQFAAEHAECVFMSGPSAKIIAPRVAGIRELAAKAGRNPAEILMFSMFTIILGRTDAEAKAKYADYVSHISAGGRAYADVRLDRRRFLDLRSRPASSPRPERCRPHRDGQHHPRRSGPGLDRARGRASMSASAASGRSWSARRKRSPTRSKHGSTQTDVDGLNVAVCDFAGRFRGHRRHAGAGTGSARALQGRLCQGNAAREIVRCKAARGSPRRIRRCSIGHAGQRSKTTNRHCLRQTQSVCAREQSDEQSIGHRLCQWIASLRSQ